MFRLITASDEQIFIEMSREFYSSEAVLAPIPEQFHINTFYELMRSDEYLICYIIEFEDQTVGYALLNKCYSHEVGGTVIWLEELYVRPKYQGRGLGSAFLDYLEVNISASRYRLETEPENERAASLYMRHGYRKLPYVQYIKGN